MNRLVPLSIHLRKQFTFLAYGSRRPICIFQSLKFFPSCHTPNEPRTRNCNKSQNGARNQFPASGSSTASSSCSCAPARINPACVRCAGDRCRRNTTPLRNPARDESRTRRVAVGRSSPCTSGNVGISVRGNCRRCISCRTARDGSRVYDGGLRVDYRRGEVDDGGGLWSGGRRIGGIGGDRGNEILCEFCGLWNALGID